MTKKMMSAINTVYSLFNTIFSIHEENPRGSSNEFKFSTSDMIESINKLESKLIELFPSYQKNSNAYHHIPFILSFDNLCEIKPLYEYIKYHQQFELLFCQLWPHSIDNLFVGKMTIYPLDYPSTLSKDIHTNGELYLDEYQSYLNRNRLEKEGKQN